MGVYAVPNHEAAENMEKMAHAGTKMQNIR
jgi:hypothetical protein